MTIPKVLKQEVHADELKEAYKKAAEEKNKKAWYNRWWSLLWRNEGL
jgi:hypothetical protein